MIATRVEVPVLLAIDAATVPASVALLSGETTLAYRVGPENPRTDAWLHPALEGCLQEAEIGLDGVEGFAVTVGPGTFTGIRVGLATCLGLAAPRELPVCGIGTLEAVAEASGVREGWLAAALDARRGQVYGALFRLPARPVPPLDAAWGPRACDPPDFARVVAERAPGAPVVGNGRRLVVRQGEDSEGLAHGPLAAAAGRLAARSWIEDGPASWTAPEPFYVRGADVRLAPNPLTKKDSASGPPDDPAEDPAEKSVDDSTEGSAEELAKKSVDDSAEGPGEDRARDSEEGSGALG